MLSLQQLTDLWNSFFHTEISAAPLVLFRVLISGLLLVNGLLLVPLTDDYFSADGLWPSSGCRVDGFRCCTGCLLLHGPSALYSLSTSQPAC
jgi:hypothetical protein